MTKNEDLTQRLENEVNKLSQMGLYQINYTSEGKILKEAPTYNNLSKFLDEHHSDECAGCELEELVFIEMDFQEEIKIQNEFNFRT